MQNSILQRIASHAAERVREAREKIPEAVIREQALGMNTDTGFPFEKALAREGLSFICECKKASPSKGLLAESFPYLAIAKSYEAAGADAISVLTEPKWFLGENAFLHEIAASVSVPCLRKDFIVDDYMLYESKLLGASAVLLIGSLLDTETLRHMLSVCDRLGLSALTEAHDESEIRSALRAGARVIGVNNRNLKDFTVDPGIGSRLRRLVPPGVLFVSESGVRSPEDIARLRREKADGVLIGEALMLAEDREQKLRELRGKEGNTP